MFDAGFIAPFVAAAEMSRGATKFAMTPVSVARSSPSTKAKYPNNLFVRPPTSCESPDERNDLPDGQPGFFDDLAAGGIHGRLRPITQTSRKFQSETIDRIYP